MKKMSKTNSVLLALLSIWRRSPYELAHYMAHSNLRMLWPGAVSEIYKGPKQLEKAGLVESKMHSTGNRKRRVYRATRKGRAAARRWLAAPSARFSCRSEAAAKVCLADLGTLEDLPRSIETVALEAEEEAQGISALLERLRDTGFDYPERAHVAALGPPSSSSSSRPACAGPASLLSS